MVAKASELIANIKTEGSLGCSDALVEFVVLKDMCQVKSEVRILNFRKAKFQLFKESVRLSWKLPSGTREQSSWQIFKGTFHSLSPDIRNQIRKAKRLARQR